MYSFISIILVKTKKNAIKICLQNSLFFPSTFFLETCIIFFILSFFYFHSTILEYIFDSLSPISNISKFFYIYISITISRLEILTVFYYTYCRLNINVKYPRKYCTYLIRPNVHRFSFWMRLNFKYAIFGNIKRFSIKNTLNKQYEQIKYYIWLSRYSSILNFKLESSAALHLKIEVHVIWLSYDGFQVYSMNKTELKYFIISTL